MVELLRFASENIGNFLITVLFLGYFLYFTALVVSKFRPINYTTIINEKKNNED